MKERSGWWIEGGRKRSKEKLACEAHVSTSVREAKRGILGHEKICSCASEFKCIKKYKITWVKRSEEL